MSGSPFFANKKCLILCAHTAVRTAVRNSVLQAGVSGKLLATKSYEEAMHFQKIEKPQIIISDFELPNGQFGIELSLVQKQSMEIQERIFGLITDNPKSSMIADAAEEEVDFVLVKPFLEQTAYDYLIKTANLKVNPSEYSQMILQGRKFLLDGHLVNAKNMFSTALALADRPALAFYYLGRVADAENDLSNAAICFDKGLAINPQHYRCLAGKFLNQVRQLQRENAYQTLQLILDRYPLTPDLLKSAFTVCVISRNFEQVDKCFKLYLALPRKPEDLTEAVVDSLITTGKLLLKEGVNDRAMDFFKKGAIISGRDEKRIDSILDALTLSANPRTYCNTFYSMLAGTEASDYLMSLTKFKILLIEKASDTDLAEFGKEIILNKGVITRDVLKATIEAAVRSGNQRLAATLANKAVQVSETYRSEFREYLG